MKEYRKEEEEEMLCELAIFNTYKTDEEKFAGIKDYYPRWLRTLNSYSKEDESSIKKETDNTIEDIRKSLKGFGVNWSGIFYHSLPFDFIVWWGKQLEYYKKYYGNKIQ